MMGRQAGGQERLFYSFNLEDHVPPNHLLRRINGCLDFSGLHQHLAKHYSQIGRHPLFICRDTYRIPPQRGLALWIARGQAWLAAIAEESQRGRSGRSTATRWPFQ